MHHSYSYISLSFLSTLPPPLALGRIMVSSSSSIMRPLLLNCTESQERMFPARDESDHSLSSAGVRVRSQICRSVRAPNVVVVAGDGQINILLQAS